MTTSFMAASVIGSKSLNGIVGTLLKKTGLMAKLLTLNRMVWPSGGALATCAVPMLPLAPPTFSI